MSGSAKRVHDDFGNNFPSGNASPAVKQHEEQHGSTPLNREITPAEFGGHTETNSESRPPKLPRLDHTNRFQKRSGIDDSVSNSPSFSVENKTDLRDGKLKVSTDEKASHSDTKMNSHEDKGDVDAWKDGRVDSGHDTDRSNRNGNSSSSWKREQRIEGREDSREAWKDSPDDKWETKAEVNEDKGERDSLKDGRSDHNHDSKAAMADRGNRGNVIRRDQRFDHKDDASWKEHKEHRLGGRPVVDHRDWNKRIGRKNSIEEDGEVRDSEEASMENYKREEEKRPKDDTFRDRDDKEREQKVSWWSGHSNNPTDSGGRERWDKEKEKRERGREKEKEKRDHNVKDHAVKEDVGAVKQEVEDYEATKKPLPETVVSNTELERKSSKELENSKVMEPDEKERKKERDREKKVDHERSTDKKEADEQGPDDERDKDSFVNYGFQQKKRMLRPRGHPQSANRDGRPRPKDLDGNSGGAEVTTILYKPGEYMSELSKLWKEYELSLAQKNGEGTSPGQGPTLEIQIPSKLVTTSNHQVRSSQLWGTDVYTDDSDLVAVLMHTGYYRPTASHPPPSVQELRATIRVLHPLDSYTSTLRNNIRSRAWGAASGCSYSVEQCRIIKVGGGQIDLEPCLTRISAVAPTLAPAAMERTMTTRAASSNAYRQHRFVQEVTIQYNLCNEPWMKYSMSIVADRGLKKSQYTSARLRKGEVLYVETHRKRYELSYESEKVACIGATTATSDAGDKNRHKDGDKSNGEKTQGRPYNDKGHQNGDAFDHYKWSCCKQPLPLKVMLAKGVPLPNDFVEVLEDGLAWEEIQWSQAGVWVRGKEYPLARAQFLSQNLENYE